MASETCHLSLGSNLGDRERNLQQALAAMDATERIRLVAASRIYETEPWGVEGEQPLYLNLAATIATDMAIPELAAALRAIERAMGRPANSSNQPRVIDIDLLLCGQAVFNAGGVRVPHAEMAGRAFVLAPLREIAADAVHPVAKLTIAQMAAQVDMAPVRVWRGGGR